MTTVENTMTTTAGDIVEPMADPVDVPAEGSASPAPSVDKPEPDFKPTFRFILAFLTLSIITLAAAFDATSLSVALPMISQKLHGTAIEAFWAGTSFLLTSTVIQPVAASFSHIFGRRPMLFIALTFFTVGAIVAGLSHNFTTMLVGRSIQGIGGGGILTLTEIIVTDLVPLRWRGQWFGFLSGMWSLGSVVGPIMGGGFAQNVSWRWIFWINLPLCGLAFVMIALFLNLQYTSSSMWARLARVDWVGIVIFVASVTGFLIPISWGGVMYPWSSWRTLVPLIVCFFGMVAFVLWEAYVAPEPLIRLRIFANRTAAVSYLGTLLHGMILWSLVYYLPLYYEAVKGFSPILSGIALFPETFTVAPAAVVVGMLISYTNNFRNFVWAGWVLTTLGAGILTLMNPQTSTAAWIFENLVVGLGTGVLFPAMAFATQAAASNADVAFAVAMFAFFRAFGQAIGVAVGGVVFQNQIKQKLLGFADLAGNATAYSQDAAALVQVIKSLPAGSQQRVELTEAYADALRIVWAVMCALAGVALIASLWTKNLDLNREHETEQGFEHGKKKADEEKVLPEA